VLSAPARSDRKRVPLWHRIEGILRHKIATAEYRVGDALPSEPALAAAFGVSRMTVREAIRGLMVDGLVRQIQGKGTFVLAGPAGEPRSARITGFVGNVRFNEAFPTASADPSRRVPHCSLVEIVTVEPPADVRRMLEIDDPTVTRLERVLTDDNGTLGYVLDYLPVAIGDRLSRDDLTRAWLTQVLPEKLGIPVLEAHQTIEATLADVVLGEKLDIPFGAPLLHAERIYYGQDGRRLYVAKVWHRGDRFRYGAVFRFQAGAESDGELR
jgi:GntR family transcriptional regulator